MTVVFRSLRFLIAFVRFREAMSWALYYPEDCREQMAAYEEIVKEYHKKAERELHDEARRKWERVTDRPTTFANAAVAMSMTAAVPSSSSSAFSPEQLQKLSRDFYEAGSEEQRREHQKLCLHIQEQQRQHQKLWDQVYEQQCQAEYERTLAFGQLPVRNAWDAARSEEPHAVAPSAFQLNASPIETTTIPLRHPMELSAEKPAEAATEEMAGRDVPAMVSEPLLIPISAGPYDDVFRVMEAMLPHYQERFASQCAVSP